MPLPTLPDAGSLSSIGHIVTIGAHLYRSRFKAYLKLAFIAHLWLLVPIYGWAKAYAIAALLARLAFNHLTDQTEPEESLQKTFAQKKWRILILNVAIAIRLASFLLLVYLLFVAFLGIIGVIFAIEPIQKLSTLPKDSPASLTIGGIGLFVLMISGLWFYARYFLVELPLSLECEFRVNPSLKRSCQLTKGMAFKSLGVLLTVLALTLIPTLVVANHLGVRLVWFPLRWLLLTFQVDISIRWVVFYLVWVTLCLLVSAVTMPFWQTTKAVLYYNLRSQREGFDLRLPTRQGIEPLGMGNYSDQAYFED